MSYKFTVENKDISRVSWVGAEYEVKDGLITAETEAEAIELLRRGYTPQPTSAKALVKATADDPAVPRFTIDQS